MKENGGILGFFFSATLENGNDQMHNLGYAIDIVL